jgi:hypothetical protein
LVLSARGRSAGSQHLLNAPRSVGIARAGLEILELGQSWLKAYTPPYFYKTMLISLYSLGVKHILRGVYLFL